MAAAFVDVWVNCPDRATAERIAAACVGDRLAACANVYAPIESLYRWKGGNERAREIPLLLKTRASLFDELCRAVKRMHPMRSRASWRQSCRWSTGTMPNGC